MSGNSDTRRGGPGKARVELSWGKSGRSDDVLLGELHVKGGDAEWKKDEM